jgi:hypothetical protein
MAIPNGRFELNTESGKMDEQQLDVAVGRPTFEATPRRVSLHSGLAEWLESLTEVAATPRSMLRNAIAVVLGEGTDRLTRSMELAFCAEPIGIEVLRAKLTKWLSIPPEDADLIDFCLAVYKSHELPGDPLWGIVIDASGGGKTEILRAFRSLKDAYFLSKLTEKTLVSGYRDPKNGDKDPSLLPELNEKVLIIKDLAPILAMRRESRSAIIADLRDAYDGFTDQGRGNVGKVAYESRFSLLTAATLAIDRGDAVDQELGERFIKFRCHGDANRNKIRKAISNIGSDNVMRIEIDKAISSFLCSLPGIAETPIPEPLQEQLAKLSDFTAKARSHVARNRNGDLQYLPRPEVGTRLGKELGKLLLALAAVRGRTEPNKEDFATVARVAEDCLPPNRSAVLKALRIKGVMTLNGVEEATGLPHKTADRVLDDLRVLGVVELPNPYQWSLANEWK